MSKSNSVGTVLKIGTGSSAKTVGGLTSIGGVNISAESIDVTSLDNSDGYREKLPGFKEGEDVSISGFLDGSDDGQNELYSLFESGASAQFSIIFPAAIGKTWSFTGHVTGFSTSADVGDAITFEGTLIISGKPTLASTASA